MVQNRLIVATSAIRINIKKRQYKSVERFLAFESLRFGLIKQLCRSNLVN